MDAQVSAIRIPEVDAASEHLDAVQRELETFFDIVEGALTNRDARGEASRKLEYLESLLDKLESSMAENQLDNLFLGTDCNQDKARTTESIKAVEEKTRRVMESLEAAAKVFQTSQAHPQGHEEPS